MRRAFCLLATSIFIISASCGRQPCDEGEATKGPRVRLDLALQTCNMPPVAMAIAPGTVDRRSTVNLDASGSIDPNGDALSFTWTLERVPTDSKAEIADRSAGKTSFTADRVGTYQIELLITDGELESDPQTIIVVARNAAPVANAGSSYSVNLNQLVTLDGTASSDPDGDPLTYRWSLTSRPTGSRAMLDNPALPRPSFTADEPGSFVATLIVNDGAIDSAPANVTIVAGASGGPPTANAGLDRSMVGVGMAITLDGSGSSDPDGDALTYEWRITRAPNGSTAMLSSTSAVMPMFTPDVEGTYDFELIVADQFFRSQPDYVTVTTQMMMGSTGGSRFDPEKMWVIGATELTGGRSLVCDPENANTVFSAGFEGVTSWTNAILNRDGALIYATGARTLHEFRADTLPYDPRTQTYIYPTDPLGNDPLIPTPPCMAGTAAGPLDRFLVSAQDNSIVYRCSNDLRTWYRNGAAIPVCDAAGIPDVPMAIGRDGSMLCEQTVMDTMGVTRPTGVGPPDLHAIRSLPGMGWRAVSGSNGIYSLIEIMPDGMVTVNQLLDDYLPEYTVRAGDHDGYSRLDGMGRFHRWAVRTADPMNNDLIIRWLANNVFEDVYDEATNPFCKLHLFYFITGS